MKIYRAVYDCEAAKNFHDNPFDALADLLRAITTNDCLKSRLRNMDPGDYVDLSEAYIECVELKD